MSSKRTQIKGGKHCIRYYSSHYSDRQRQMKVTKEEERLTRWNNFLRVNSSIPFAIFSSSISEKIYNDKMDCEHIDGKNASPSAENNERLRYALRPSTQKSNLPMRVCPPRQPLFTSYYINEINNNNEKLTCNYCCTLYQPKFVKHNQLFSLQFVPPQFPPRYTTYTVHRAR